MRFVKCSEKFVKVVSIVREREFLKEVIRNRGSCVKSSASLVLGRTEGHMVKLSCAHLEGRVLLRVYGLGYVAGASLLKG